MALGTAMAAALAGAALSTVGGAVKGIIGAKSKGDANKQEEKMAKINQTKPVLGDDFADGLVDDNRFDLSYAGKPVIFGQNKTVDPLEEIRRKRAKGIF